MNALLFLFSGPRRLLTPRSACALVVLVGVSGCGKTLMGPDEPRSQYERFDRVRGQYVETYVFDAFGQRRPNLHYRLLGEKD